MTSGEMILGDNGNDATMHIIAYGDTTANASARLTVSDDSISHYYTNTRRQHFQSDGVWFDNGGLFVGSNSIITTNGLIKATNDVVAFATSDRRLKENIKPIKNPLIKLSKINGVEFDWKPTTEEEKRFVHANEGHDIGVIAQEIEKVIPEIVETREKSGYKAVKYEKIVPLLIEAIKELKQEVDELKKQIK
mgnify:FL=1